MHYSVTIEFEAMPAASHQAAAKLAATIARNPTNPLTLDVCDENGSRERVTIAPTPEPETFGEVSWCDDDVKQALKEKGYKQTPDNIETIKSSYYARHIADTMIEQGWEMLYLAIEDADDLEPLKARKTTKATR